MSAPKPWAILTGEFPPRCGGVGDYTAQVAAALAEAGDEVIVFRPPANGAPLTSDRVQIVTLPDHFGPAARGVIARRLEGVRARLLVQYVPQAFGMRGANVPFCRWLRRRFQQGDDIRVMFHEPYFYLTLHPGQAALAAFQRAMAAVLLRASTHVYVSTAAWLPYLSPYASRRFKPVVLPIPSAIPAVTMPSVVEATRARMLNGSVSRLVGHFGTYGDHIAPLVREAVCTLLSQDTSIAALCIGEGSNEFVADVARRVPALAPRIHATGRLTAEGTSVHLQACDVLIQPYPDGVTTRRTSIMAGLANGLPVVTTDGELTEPLWRTSHAAALVPARDTVTLAATARQLLYDRSARAALGLQAASAYAAEFAIERTITALRDGEPPA